MKRQSIYRRITALAFLMLYLFIAMPVQFWHHHKDDSSKTSVVKISKETPGKSLQSENCKICQHTYAPYVGAYPNFSIGPLFIITGKKSQVIISYPDHFVAQLSNKSPPAV